MELVSKYFSLLQRQNKLQNAEFDDEAQTYTMIFRQTQSRGGGRHHNPGKVLADRHSLLPICLRNTKETIGG